MVVRSTPRATKKFSPSRSSGSDWPLLTRRALGDGFGHAGENDAVADVVQDVDVMDVTAARADRLARGRDGTRACGVDAVAVLRQPATDPGQAFGVQRHDFAVGCGADVEQEVAADAGRARQDMHEAAH